MNKNLAPIVIFVYSRLEHTKKTIESLKNSRFSNESDVWIFSDAAKNEKTLEKVKNVREYIHSIENKNYFKNLHIIEADENKGLANSVISGVEKVISTYGKVIVLEDDLEVSTTFLEYMNNALEFYENNNNIWSISGYGLPIKMPKNYQKDIYLSYRGCSWGWATWKDRWKKVDWNVSDYEEFKNNRKRRIKFNNGGNDMSRMLDAQMNGKIDSWAIRWCYEQSKRNMYTIYPVKSLVHNMGMDGSGTHSGTTKKFIVKCYDELPQLTDDLQIENKIVKSFKNCYSKRIKGKIVELLTLLGIEKVITVMRGVKKS